MCIEYSLRYKRTHKSEEVIDWCDNNKDLLIFQSVDRQAFIQALPDRYKCSSPIKAYRKYYLQEKMRFAKWEKGREAPDWISGYLGRCLYGNVQKSMCVKLRTNIAPFKLVYYIYFLGNFDLK
ncbi:hypothetical protein NOX90_02455 [Wolbachia endosymbiont of Anurida maritima]